VSAPAKPLPRPTPESQRFWDGAAAHRLMLPRCDGCGQFWFPPSRRCRHCLSPRFTWREAKGTGRIYSFVVFHRVYHPGFEADVPYTVALVALDEGPRFLTTIVGIDPTKVRCDMDVRVVFDDVAPGIAVPKFAPA
jgi:uncharacterized OB-fold protein